MTPMEPESSISFDSWGPQALERGLKVSLVEYKAPQRQVTPGDFTAPTTADSGISPGKRHHSVHT